MKSHLLQLYARYLQDEDQPTFFNSVSQSYLAGTLERLTSSACVLTRRGAVLSLGLMGTLESSPVLANLLGDPDNTLSSMAEQAIGRTWFRTGSVEHQKELLVLQRQNHLRRFDEVLHRATRLIELNPDIAETWNQRAIAHYSLCHFNDSIRDYRETLKRNPLHFPATIGLGNSYLESRNFVEAIASFKRCLQIHPGLKTIQDQVNFLVKSLN
ncbi:MAG: hypothetical protein VX768_12990 [Planctomycetota bacterium]|nr:hypothetical protein [Planctomycetota bacterium]